ncbi:MAG: NusG domain II-containing protein [Lachnospiraceae bacterium]|nr:NusG domain II-containing protein [Lachnospiraceae bacterium]
MNKRDILLIITVIILSVAGTVAVYSRSSPGIACIYIKGSLYGQYDLAVPSSIHITSDNGIVNDIEISEGSIYMKNATCPGKQCMACGRISRSNESICCAPAQLLIVISSDREREYDAITQ